MCPYIYNGWYNYMHAAGYRIICYGMCVVVRYHCIPANTLEITMDCVSCNII